MKEKTHMGILEDAPNISPAGKGICLLAFLLGVIGLGMATSQIGKAENLAEKVRKEVVTQQMLPSHPEDVATEFSLIEPQNEAERGSRAAAVRTRLKGIREKLDGKEKPATPSKILLEAVKTGNIHPNLASQLWGEMNLITPNPADKKILQDP